MLFLRNIKLLFVVFFSLPCTLLVPTLDASRTAESIVTEQVEFGSEHISQEKPTLRVSVFISN